MNYAVLGAECTVAGLAEQVGQPQLMTMIRKFLHIQLYPSATLQADTCLPHFNGKVSVFPSAKSTFYAPSDQSGISGMHSEWIRSAPAWRKQKERRDTVLVSTNNKRNGFSGMDIARAMLLFSFNHENVTYPCVLVQWFRRVANQPCPETGMWIVEKESGMDVIHLGAVIRGVHLLPVFGEDFVPHQHLPEHTLDAFDTFYVNKFADHHSHETLFE